MVFYEIMLNKKKQDRMSISPFLQQIYNNLLIIISKE